MTVKTADVCRGMRFGKLVTIKKTTKTGSRTRHAWVCRCDCGAIKIILVDNFTRGGAISCGCAKGTHKLSATPEYKIWSSMKSRCGNPNNPRYKDYGGRGIKVCKRWRLFENFIADIGKRPDGDYLLERKNNNKGYSPENCRWATRKEQQRNMRRNHVIEFNGKKQTLIEWCEQLHIPKGTLATRLYRGWTIERALMKR